MRENTNNASEDKKEILFKEEKLIVLLIFLSPWASASSPWDNWIFFLNCLT